MALPVQVENGNGNGKAVDAIVIEGAEEDDWHFC